MTDNAFIVAARQFAHEAHGSIICPNTGLQGHRRKYAPFPSYNVHTDEVEDIYFRATHDVIGAAVGDLHDILEDVFPLNEYYSLERIRREFGDEVAYGVFDLTDQYVREAYPQWNRKVRKQKERERLGLVSTRSKGVKLADLISNTTSIVRDDPDFAKTYLREKLALLPHLVGGDASLWKRALELANDGCAKLGIVV